MLLAHLVFGQQHITSACSALYLDPTPELQRAWKAAAAGHAPCNGAPLAAAAATGGSSKGAGGAWTPAAAGGADGACKRMS